MIDKNLFLYDLAVVAIFKNEGPYLKEWLDYHLLAGVDHFYLYNNESSDDYKKILAPYVEKNLVTLTEWPGNIMQIPAYNDAIDKYRFECRFMAFIDLDEFIFPKTNQKISEVVEEIFSRDSNAAGLGINWQVFGSNGQKKADYSRDVLERFTRRAPSDWFYLDEDGTGNGGGNAHIKAITNPRGVNCVLSPHYVTYFSGLKSINENGKETTFAGSIPVSAEKIVLNHYYVKSLEEFSIKINRGSACRTDNHKTLDYFYKNDKNEEFDDGILKYRAARAQNFSLESDAEKIRRVEKALVEILTQCSPFNAPAEFFKDKLETFLTCRAVAEKLSVKIGDRSAEEYALVWIYQTFIQSTPKTHTEFYQFIKALPDILARPFPICKKINLLTRNVLIPSFCETLKSNYAWEKYTDLLYNQKFLSLMK